MIKTKRLFTIFMVLFMGVLFVACGGGGGGGGGVSPDPTIKFQLFPPTYFSGAYSETYELEGYVDGSDIEKGYFKEVTTEETSGRPNFLTFQTLNVDNDDEVFDDKYHYLEVLNNGYSIEKISSLSHNGAPVLLENNQSNTIIPLTAAIGESGEIGAYRYDDLEADEDNMSHDIVIKWSLEGGADGRAKLSITRTLEYEEYKGQFYEVVISFIINQEGVREGVEISQAFTYEGEITHLTGIRKAK